MIYILITIKPVKVIIIQAKMLIFVLSRVDQGSPVISITIKHVIAVVN